jgi:hypothetical protein
MESLTLPIGDVFSRRVRKLDSAVVSAQKSILGKSSEIASNGLSCNLKSSSEILHSNGSIRSNDLKNTGLPRIEGAAAGGVLQSGLDRHDRQGQMLGD